MGHPMPQHPLPRRTLLAAGTASLALAPAAALAAPDGSPASPGGARRSAPFTLRAEVLDGGEQVTAVLIEAGRAGGLASGDIAPTAFTVHARGTNPLTGEDAFDQDREVTAASIDHRGLITLELLSGYEVPGASTLEYLEDASRNVQLDLEYTITQSEPLPFRGNGALEGFEQGDLVSAEVDPYEHLESASGLKYRLFSPATTGRPREYPLVVWLHGGGEGGTEGTGYDYYDNETTLRANRGALGFSTAEAQDIFGGAFVLAPQSPSAWMEDGDRFAPLIAEAIEEVASSQPIDRHRIHVLGCSNGGYMTLKMQLEYPEVFASGVPICPGVAGFFTDEEVASISSPTWIIASADDDTIDAEANAVHASELIEGSILSLYDTVTWEGVQYPGHWSWIYAARNDPQAEGVSLWEWMAAQER